MHQTRPVEIKNFTELIVWQRAMDLVIDVYRVTAMYPRSERFVLTVQTERAAISIPSNIAEGFRRQRRSLGAYLYHLDVARGSEGELFTQLEVARRLGYVPQERLTKPLGELVEIGKMLNGLIGALETRGARRSHR